MNLHELNYFLTLAEQLHFGRASQLCHLSPSALTRSIKRLEQSVGHTLFLRDNRSVTLTPEGEQFLHYAKRTLLDWEALRNELRDGGEIGGSLSIYASVTAVYTLLPDLLESYRKRYPKVHLELHTGSAEQSVQQVLAGTSDLAIAALPDRRLSGLQFLPLTETDLVFVGPKDQAQPLDLHSMPLVIPRSGLARKRLDHWLRQHDTRPTISSEVSGNEGILAMVRLGCGIGIVPELVLQRSPFRHDIQIMQNAPQLAPYTVGLCTTGKNLRRASIRALWQLVEEKNSPRTT